MWLQELLTVSSSLALAVTLVSQSKILLGDYAALVGVCRVLQSKNGVRKYERNLDMGKSVCVFSRTP